MSTINEIIKDVECRVNGDTAADISGISHDSREIKPGYVFVCIKGEKADGKDYIREVLERGARAVVSDDSALELPAGIVHIIVNNPLKALAELSANFYGHPSRNLYLVGITGTNGKTTISYLVESIFAAAGLPTAVFGTIKYQIGDETITAKNTTPLSSDLQRMLAQAVKKNMKAVAMEVSSHSLVLERVTGCEFDTAVFTNLTRDHLDFHKTFEEYFNAKFRLFEMLAEKSSKRNKKFAVINIDDPYGIKMPARIKAQVLKYGLTGEADIQALDIKICQKKTKFTVKSGAGSTSIVTPLLGKHNIHNILAAWGCGVAKGIEPQIIKEGIEKLKNVPGRLERVDCGQNFTVLVDYAHTPDALENVLNTVAGLEPRRVITVFGCGGNRDRTKRPIMGEIAVNKSNYVIVTSDNPRNENPEKILLDIEVGIRKTGKDNYEMIIDREEAIRRALNIAGKDDVVLIAGKGHENYQIIGEKRIDFDDREAVRKILGSGINLCAGSNGRNKNI